MSQSPLSFNSMRLRIVSILSLALAIILAGCTPSSPGSQTQPNTKTSPPSTPLATKSVTGPSSPVSSAKTPSTVQAPPAKVEGSITAPTPKASTPTQVPPAKMDAPVQVSPESEADKKLFDAGTGRQVKVSLTARDANWSEYLRPNYRCKIQGQGDFFLVTIEERGDRGAGFIGMPVFPGTDTQTLVYHIDITAPSDTVLTFQFMASGQEPIRVKRPLIKGRNDVYLSTIPAKGIESTLLIPGTALGDYKLHRLEVVAVEP